MSQKYENAEAVEVIARSLIPSHHSELINANFRYIFKEKAGKKGGKIVAGTVKKMSDLMVHLLDCHFLMEIALDQWSTLDDQKRTALVDHLLERCVGEEDEKSGEMKWKTREPDVNEFASIIRRHGVWNADLVNFVSVGQSIDLSYMTDSVEAEVETTTSAEG